MNKKASHNIEDDHAVEKLFIRAFKSACALKNEIRKRIRQRADGQWDFCGLSSKGAFIFLCFRKRAELETASSGNIFLSSFSPIQ